MVLMIRIVVVLMCCLAAPGAAAKVDAVFGKVTDGQDNGIDMATIALLDSGNNVIAVCTSDSAGCFSVATTPLPTSLLVSCIGYKPCKWMIDKARQQVFVNIRLEADTTLLAGVVVTSGKPIVRREIDRLTLDAERLSPTARNFLDILKHAPGVIVHEDAISMLNKGKLVFLMDGRELKIDMKTLMMYLGSLNSDNLKAIELMTAPPSKYSSEGDAGVINFVTKKMKSDYWGGSFANCISIKERVYDEASFNLQYKHGKFESYVSVGAGLGTVQTDKSSRVVYPAETWLSDIRKLKSNDYVIVTAGIDYALSGHSSLGAMLSYNNMQPSSDQISVTSIFANGGDGGKGHYETFTDFDCNYNRYNANLRYSRHDIGRGGSLEVNADFLDYHISDKVNLHTTHDEPLGFLRRNSPDITIWQLKADMEFTFGKALFSYGAACSKSNTDNRTDYEHMTNGCKLDDHFRYGESIFAAYADLRGKLNDKTEAKVGIRCEYDVLDGKSIKMSQQSVKHQFDLFPTLYIKYRCNDDNTLSLSVTSRINRPNYVDLNPFTTYVDAHTIQTGNPNLQPMKSYMAELGFTHKAFSISASAKRITSVMSPYTDIDEVGKMSRHTVDNVMDKSVYNLNLSYYFDCLKWLDFYVDGSVYMVSS